MRAGTGSRMSAAPLLVADIGGTNARFAVAEIEGGAVQLLHKETMQAEDFEHLHDAARAFLESWSGPRPERAVFAVAGPVNEAEIVFTNSTWRFVPAALQSQLRLSQLKVINDFEAMARGAVAAKAEDLDAIKTGAAREGAPVAVTGPGTGLGLAVVLRHADGDEVIATEAGHAAFAPRTEKEIEVLKFVMREHDFVSYERLLSGRGLVTLHRALCAVNGVTRVTLRPEDITAAALARTLPVAAEATAMFCDILGTFAGDAALITGARGGVILAGGILPRIEPILRESAFIERFVEREPMRAYLEAIPVRLLTSGVAALEGAARA